jgi:hypothetical protein
MTTKRATAADERRARRANAGRAWTSALKNCQRRTTRWNDASAADWRGR